MDKPTYFKNKFYLRIFKSVNSEFENQLLGIGYFWHIEDTPVYMYTAHTFMHIHDQAQDQYKT